MTYVNLDLEAFGYRNDGGTERFAVRVANSPVGEQRQADAEEVALPSNLRMRLRRLEKRQLDLPGIIELGEDLGRALWPPRARLFLDRSRERLREDEGLRIRLRLDAYALADLPWEYVYLAPPDTPPDQKEADGFLVLDRKLSLVRYEVMGQSPGTLDPVGTGPLRLVALLADPGTADFPALNLAAERETVQQALAKLSDCLQAEYFDRATVDVLDDALVSGAHIFHFAGHGTFEGDLGATYGNLEGAGSLVLLNDHGRPELFPAGKLALLLRGSGVRLAVLGACEGGRRDGVNAWTGVAPALTRAGIPAVVAMQYSIYDYNATVFSRAFYGTLAEGKSVDAAVAAGRLAIFTRGDNEERDWGVPVLYLRASQGVLFPRPVVGGLDPTTARGPSAAPASPPLPSPASERIDARALRAAITQAFSEEELAVLCADVEAEWRDKGITEPLSLEIVGGSGKTAKVLNLIQYLERRGRLLDLVKAVRSARPGII